MRKLAFDTSEDPPNGLRQRNPEGVLTEGAERSNVETTNGILDGLFARKGQMQARAKAQLGDLFDNAEGSYGRARAVGMTAEQASRVVDRAFRSGR